MKQSMRSLFLITIPLVTLEWIASINTAKAQITPDNSLGAESSVVTPNVEIKGIPSDRIDEGAIRGANLFHSFQQFNVGEARGVYFSNPAGIANIFSRVTGNNPSNILGTLGVLGNANLFFINSNGIVFGPNARLDVGGSFLASTANSLVFGNNFEFSATNPQAPPPLTINIPIGLQFRDNPGSITNQSTRLRVQSGNSLALVGGDLSLDGGTVTAAGGRVELGGLAGTGTVGLNADGNNLLGLRFPDNLTRADVSLTNGAFVDVTAGGGGSIAVNARNLNISGESALYAGISQGSGSTGSQAGDITLNARRTITVTNGFIYNYVDSGAIGNSGNLTIETDRLSIGNGSQIATYTSGRGNPGKLTINASDSVELNGAGPNATLLTSQITHRGTGNGGDLTINTKQLSVINGAQVFTSSFGIGNVGNLTIETGRLSIRDGSIVSTSTAGTGNAGKLFIKADDLVEVVGTEEPGNFSRVSASVSRGFTGKGGDLTIETKKLVIRSSQVSTTVFGKGDVGNLTVNASESVEITGKVFATNPNPGKPPIRNPAGLFSQVNTQGEGNGGNLTVTTPRLSIGDGGKIQVAVFGKGNLGNVLIRASDIDIYETPGKADFFEGGIFVGFQVDEDETTALPKGDFVGTIAIETDRLRVRDGGIVTVSTESDQNAGTLRITAKDSIEVFGEVVGRTTNRKFTSSISARATADSTGNGGTLILDTDKLIVRDRGQITVSSENNKPAGNLEITARTINLNNQGGITATAKGGDGGNITFNIKDYLFMRRNSEISTSAGTQKTSGGNGGNIFINNLPGYRGFVIATLNENSDITANAFRGQGGQVVINSNGIFGFVSRSGQDLERLRPSDLDPRQIPTNDITAISQQNPSLSGTVTLTTPEVDPNRGLIELPENVVDPSQLIAQNPCQQGAGSKFIVTGRGGLPLSPNQTISSDNVRVDLVESVANTRNSNSTTQNQQSPSSTVKQIVPAQGWIFNKKGEVVLTAYDPTSTGFQRSWQTPAACPAF